MKHIAKITATDSIGRTSAITLRLDEPTIRRLINAEYTKANAIETINELRFELNELIESSESAKYYGLEPEISYHQRLRLRNFLTSAYNRFGGYTLHIDADLKN